MARRNKKLKKAHKRILRQWEAQQMMMMQQQGGLAGGLSSLLPRDRTGQFVVGALVGAAAAWVLSDEELRGKMMKSGLKAWADLTGSLEEMKEQMADMQAELAAGQAGDAFAETFED